MPKVIESFKGDTKAVCVLREQIDSALKQGSVKVKLWQPGIMYQQGDNWLTVIDFINEWREKPVVFYSNLVPLRRIECEFHYTNDMFISDNRLYQKNPLCRRLLDCLQPMDTPRKFYWDFLFGQQKDHKDKLYPTFLRHPVASRTLHTYFGNKPELGIWSHGHVPKQHSAETVDGNENAFDNPVRHSDLIDPEIYNQTYYSAVIETVIHNDFAMFSEKEAKPIMSQRPFVVFGARHQLRAFRSLGFKTFSDIIDESYDDIIDHDERFDAVLNSMDQMCGLDPKAVYQRLKLVLEHNKKHFLENNWTNI